jgi:hypothetical protein
MAGEEGRPPKLTPELTAKLCNAISGGNYYNAACAYAGISYRCFRGWMKKGKQSKSGKYFQFFQAIKKAEADAEVRIVLQWQQHIPDNWQAARDFLDRRFQARWGSQAFELRMLRKEIEELRRSVINSPTPSAGQMPPGPPPQTP